MRDDHKLTLKKIKQQILAFCLRHNYRYDGNSHWTAAHLRWLKSLQPEALYKEILDEYLLTYTTLSDKLERLDKRIEELASKDEYKEAVKKLCCFIGVKTHTALSVLVEVGDVTSIVLQVPRILHPIWGWYMVRIPVLTIATYLELPKLAIDMFACC